MVPEKPIKLSQSDSVKDTWLMNSDRGYRGYVVWVSTFGEKQSHCWDCHL